MQIIINGSFKNTKENLIKKRAVLSQAIHTSGRIVQAAVMEDIATYPSVDNGIFKSTISVDNSRELQSRVYSPVSYAKFLEKGTSSHFITPKTKKVLAWKSGGKWFYSKGHMVSGIAPRHHFGRTARKMAPIVRAYVEARLKAVS